MGRANRKDRTRCKPCLDKGERTHPMPYDRKGDGVVLLCKNCGHKYISYSKAAMRMADAILGNPKSKKP